MEDQIRRTCRLSVFLKVLVPYVRSCQAAPSPRQPQRPFASFVESGRCCERVQIHDLYVAPYGLAPRQERVSCKRGWR